MAPAKVTLFDVIVNDSFVTFEWTNPDSSNNKITHEIEYTNTTNKGTTKIPIPKEKKISNLVNGDTYKFVIHAKDTSSGDTTSSDAVIRTMNKGDKPSKSIFDSGAITSVIAFLVGLADVGIIYFFGLDADGKPELAIASVAIITFFGVLFISAHHNHTNAEDQRKHATGTMRRAMAASIILVYIITFSMTTFGDFQDKTIETSQNEIAEEIKEAVTSAIQNNNSEDGDSDTSMIDAITKVLDEKLPKLEKNLELDLASKTTLLGHFTTVTSMVVIFYFGSKAIENWFGKKNQLDKKLLKNSIDDIKSKLTATNVDESKESLEKLSKTLE